MENFSIKELNNFLKVYYAAELGVAALSEISLASSGLGLILAPVVQFQRFNATVQTLGWAALITYLGTLERAEATEQKAP